MLVTEGLAALACALLSFDLDAGCSDDNPSIALALGHVKHR
jgi:hypothetical protein